MKRLQVIIFFFLTIAIFMACSNEEDFTINTSAKLSFSTDTVNMDTVFAKIPTSTKTFWVYNKTDHGIRCSSVSIENGNQVGFRVNVDGTELSKEHGYSANNIEIRKGDSVRVFVELTSLPSNTLEPTLTEDNLVFTLESGVQQKVNLKAYIWNADVETNITISNDSVISTNKPLIVYGGIIVKENATLKIAKGTTIYFHDKAGIDVYGRLLIEGDAENRVVLRGDRLDNMFDYLPYNNVSGQWRGIVFKEKSMFNSINFADIHSAVDAIVCDSSNIDNIKLNIKNSIIHNNKGVGIRSINSNLNIENCQITNSMNGCLAVYGGKLSVNHCTIAQFYGFDSNRGAALSVGNNYNSKDYPLLECHVRNSIITGYSNDEVMFYNKENVEMNYNITSCLMRTPEPTEENKNIENVIFEDITDTIASGEKNFKRIDIDKLQYNFKLSEKSIAISKADKTTSLPYDIVGMKRDDEPDLGCYEYVGEDKNKTNY